jgi:hypothetical protein
MQQHRLPPTGPRIQRGFQGGRNLNFLGNNDWIQHAYVTFPSKTADVESNSSLRYDSAKNQAMQQQPRQGMMVTPQQLLQDPASIGSDGRSFGPPLGLNRGMNPYL